MYFGNRNTPDKGSEGSPRSEWGGDQRFRLYRSRFALWKAEGEALLGALRKQEPNISAASQDTSMPYTPLFVTIFAEEPA